MREENFLPYELKDKRFKRRRYIINYSIILIFIINCFLALHIYYGIYKINYEKKPNEVGIQVFNNINKEKSGVLDFFQENIVDHFLYEEANLKESTLSLKIIIRDKDEFSKYVKDLEKIKKSNIEYLIAPYEDNDVIKFEVGLEVKQ